MELGNSVVFFLKALLFGIAVIVAIPKEQYKKFFAYGFVLGGLGDLAVTSILSKVLHLIQYMNMGPFAVLGLLSFWTPIAWMFVFMLFLYLLPIKRVYICLHVLGFAVFGYMVGQVLGAFGLFQYIGIQKYLAPIVFLLWFSIAAWIYIRSEKIELH